MLNNNIIRVCWRRSRFKSVCGLKKCKKNKGTCVFGTSTMVGRHKWKCGLHDNCCFKVIFSNERKNHGKQSDGDPVLSCQGLESLFDHSLTCSALGAPSKQLTKSMVYNSLVANSMLTFCKNVNVPEIMQWKHVFKHKNVFSHKSPVSFVWIFVYSLWTSVLSSTNKTTSRAGHFTPCSPWIPTTTWSALMITSMTRKTKRGTTGWPEKSSDLVAVGDPDFFDRHRSLDRLSLRGSGGEGLARRLRPGRHLFGFLRGLAPPGMWVGPQK